MDKEELIEFLKTELSIDIDIDYSSYISGVGLKVELALSGEVISSETIAVDSEGRINI